jgi:hypothetical protein
MQDMKSHSGLREDSSFNGYDESTYTYRRFGRTGYLGLQGLSSPVFLDCLDLEDKIRSRSTSIQQTKKIIVLHIAIFSVF